MVYGKLPRTMPSTLEEWKNVCTLHNEAMAQQLAIALGYPSSWRACRYPRHAGRPDFIYDATADDNAEEAGYCVPVGGPVAKFDVGDVVEIREEPVKPACAATNIMMAHTERVPQDLQWYKATITKKTEYLNDIRYKVQNSVDDTVQSNVRESEMRAVVVEDNDDDLIIDIVPIMTAYKVGKKKEASMNSRTPTKRQPRTSKHASPTKSGAAQWLRHIHRLVTPKAKTKPTGVALDAAEYLKAWMMSPEHVAHPYPTKQEKAEIMAETGITPKQLANWFVNNRKRYWKPRVEEMHRKKEKDKTLQEIAAADLAKYIPAGR